MVRGEPDQRLAGGGSLNSNVIGSIAERDWLVAWDSSPIRSYIDAADKSVGSSVPKLSTWKQPAFNRTEIDKLFGLSESHFLNAKHLDWGFELTEPQATRGLAHFINKSHRNERAKAILHGLGVRPLPERIELKEAQAEQDRIDLLLVWQEVDGEKHSTVVEAKFGHSVTEGQLSKYRKSVKSRHRRSNTDYVLLLVDPEQHVRLRGTQNRLWRKSSWASLLLGIEQALPIEADDEDFQRFRRMLWSKVHGLRQGQKR